MSQVRMKNGRTDSAWMRLGWRVRRWMGRVAVCLALFVTVGQVNAQTVEYIHTDALGSPVAVTNAAGAVVERQVYEPYGAGVTRGPNDGPGFTGHVEDAATGLTYMQQRYYGADCGCFLSVDPVTAYGAGDARFFNRYVYAFNNPYKFSDLDGRATVYTYPDRTVIVQTFSNNGTQFTDEQISQQGANLSGQASSGRMIEVRLVPGNDSDSMQINPNPALDDTSEDGGRRSHIDEIGGKKIEIAPNAKGAEVVGHEIGHGLRAGDQYKDGIAVNGKKLGADVPGPANIMKTATGPANTQTIDEIERGAKRRGNTQVNCTGTRIKGGCE